MTTGEREWIFGVGAGKVGLCANQTCERVGGVEGGGVNSLMEEL